MKCSGCDKEFQEGDRYIEDTASGFMAAFGDQGTAEFDGLISTILGGEDGKLFYCEDCTTDGGVYNLKTFDGNVA